MAFLRAQKSFRFSIQTVEIMEHIGRRMGMDNTATIERLIRAEAVTMSKTDSVLKTILCRVPSDYTPELVASILIPTVGRRKKTPEAAIPDLPPPPPHLARSAGLTPE